MVVKDYFRLQAALEELKAVFVPQSDKERYGQPEYWANASDSFVDGFLYGDCDDFAIEMRRRVLDSGFRPRLMECELNDGQHHLICEVEGWLLDNLHDEPKMRQELEALGYKWVKMSGYAQEDDWTEVGLG